MNDDSGRYFCLLQIMPLKEMKGKEICSSFNSYAGRLPFYFVFYCFRGAVLIDVAMLFLCPLHTRGTRWLYLRSFIRSMMKSSLARSWR